MVEDLVLRVVPFLVSAVAAVVHPLALRCSPSVRRTWLFVLIPPLLLIPLIIAPEERLLRGIAAIFSATVLIKLYDLHVGALRGERATYREAMAFLLNPFTLVQRKLADEPVPSARANLAGLARGGAITLLAMLASVICFRWLLFGSLSFFAEHTIGAITCFAMVWAISDMAIALWRLAGLRGRRMNANFFLARTPAEFWRLYNRPVTQAAYEDYFARMKGRHRPILATLIVFALSGLMHEYIAAVAIGRVQGFQVAFFLLQGAAVVATRRIRVERLRPVPALLWTGATFAFNLASSLLFFASGNQIVHWYSDPPAWMPKVAEA